MRYIPTTEIIPLKFLVLFDEITKCLKRRWHLLDGNKFIGV
jgi:hypothetical protein